MHDATEEAGAGSPGVDVAAAEERGNAKWPRLLLTEESVALVLTTATLSRMCTKLSYYSIVKNASGRRGQLFVFIQYCGGIKSDSTVRVEGIVDERYCVVTTPQV